MQAFVTDHDRALQELYGGRIENSRKFDACLNVMATQIATVFASLKVKIFINNKKKILILQDQSLQLLVDSYKSASCEQSIFLSLFYFFCA